MNEVRQFVDDVRRFPGIDPKAIALAEERFKGWRRRLFGHPLARVFILGDRLLVLHPRGAA